MVAAVSARAAGSSPYLPIFDGYRAAAVLCIVFSHIALATAWEPSAGLLLALRRSSFLSLEFLVVVSGFVLFLPIAWRGGLDSVRSYAVRRIARIGPAYWVCLAITFLVALIAGHPPLPYGDLEVLAVHLLFLQHALSVNGFEVNQVFWMLSILAFFWALLPIVANQYVRHPLAGLLVAIAVVLFWRLLVAGTVNYEHFIQPPLFFADFATGMTAAWGFVELRRRADPAVLRRYAVPATAAALFTLVALMYTVGMMRVRGEIFYFGQPAWLALCVPAAFALLVVAGAFTPAWAQWPLSNRAARWMGNLSYGVFLFHVLILQLVLTVFGFTQDRSFWTFVTVSALVIPVSLLAGWISFTFVERPVRDWAKQWAQRSAVRRASYETARPLLPDASTATTAPHD